MGEKSHSGSSKLHVIVLVQNLKFITYPAICIKHAQNKKAYRQTKLSDSRSHVYQLFDISEFFFVAQMRIYGGTYSMCTWYRKSNAEIISINYSLSRKTTFADASISLRNDQCFMSARYC